MSYAVPSLKPIQDQIDANAADIAANAENKVLLGELSVSSGTLQTLASLDLSKYNRLELEGDNVGHTDGGFRGREPLEINGTSFTVSVGDYNGAGSAVAFKATLDLFTGEMKGESWDVIDPSPKTAINVFATVRRGTTSLDFGFSTLQEMNSGTIEIYGVR